MVLFSILSLNTVQTLVVGVLVVSQITFYCIQTTILFIVLCFDCIQTTISFQSIVFQRFVLSSILSITLSEVVSYCRSKVCIVTQSISQFLQCIQCIRSGTNHFLYTSIDFSGYGSQTIFNSLNASIVRSLICFQCSVRCFNVFQQSDFLCVIVSRTSSRTIQVQYNTCRTKVSLIPLRQHYQVVNGTICSLAQDSIVVIQRDGAAARIIPSSYVRIRNSNSFQCIKLRTQCCCRFVLLYVFSFQSSILSVQRSELIIVLLDVLLKCSSDSLI